MQMTSLQSTKHEIKSSAPLFRQTNSPFFGVAIHALATNQATSFHAAHHATDRHLRNAEAAGDVRLKCTCSELERATDQIEARWRQTEFRRERSTRCERRVMRAFEREWEVMHARRRARDMPKLETPRREWCVSASRPSPRRFPEQAKDFTASRGRGNGGTVPTGGCPGRSLAVPGQLGRCTHKTCAVRMPDCRQSGKEATSGLRCRDRQRLRRRLRRRFLCECRARRPVHSQSRRRKFFRR